MANKHMKRCVTALVIAAAAAAAAKSLQSCPTLSHPMDCSLPGSSVRGIFQARVLEWGAIAFSALVFTKMQIKYIVRYCHTLITTAKVLMKI